MENVSRTSY